MPDDHLSRTLAIWIEALESYDEGLLSLKPAENSWSIGQVYVHLIAETTFFLSQVRLCLLSDENANESASPHGLEMLANNAFPDERIEGPPSNQFVQQPSGKDQIKKGLEGLRIDIEETQRLFDTSASRGKAKHPGLSYLNAHEWYQFAEMHLRHHLRQKKRIDEFLALNGLNENIHGKN